MGVFWGSDGESDDDLLSRGRTPLSLALARFTVLFGKGRSGSTPLWSSDETGTGVSREDRCASDDWQKAG